MKWICSSYVGGNANILVIGGGDGGTVR